MQDSDRSRSALRKPRRRVRAACERCRRQKLGCDKVRPCAMCIRSGVECITSAASEARNSHQNRRRSAPSPHCESETPAELTQASRDQGASVASAPNLHRSGDEPFTLNAEDIRYESERGFSLGHHSHGPSAIDLTRQIFNKFEAGTECENETFALPGGSEVSVPHPTHDREILLRDMIGMDLPPRNVTDYLIDTYLNSVHWFMMVFHEPTFMANYSNIVDSGVVPQRKNGFVVLLMMVLTIGARYSTPQSARERCPDTDLKSLQASLLSKVKESMFEVYGEGRLEAVQTSILLASFYLYHEQPNLAFAILGAGIKSAQAMGLHRESSWKCNSSISRETRRRTWWALYVFDRFASIVFGRPCSINDADCEVSMVQNLDDTSAQHPKSNSLETLGDGTSVPVTIFTYQRFKFNLYRIASPILGNVYFLRGVTKSQVIDRVGKIHNRLLSWFSSLPEELRLGEHQPGSHNNSTPIEITFRLQAVALQLAYDNIMILLHRPLLQYAFDNTSAPTATGMQGVRVEPTDDGSSSWTPNTQSISKIQCWESAMRTSRITEHVDILRVMKNTHAAAYTGIHMFTAGVFLSVVALSHPLSSEAQEAKMAIGRVIRLSKALGHRTVLSAQSGNILQSLVRVILSKEMKEILAEYNNTDIQGGGMLSTACPSPCPPSPVGETNGFNANNTLNYLSNPRLASAQTDQGDYNPLNPGFCDMEDGRGPPGALRGADFSEGFMSVQRVIRGSSNHIAVDGFSPLQVLDQNGQVTDDIGQASTTTDPNLFANNIGNAGSIFGGAYGGLNDSGQSWMWEMDPTLSYFDTCQSE